MESRLDVTKARELLGFEARTGLEDGVKGVIHWLRG
jgi:nucleoside-diphosphate-sugar epimerase